MNTNTPELTTDRLLLRKFTEDDVEALFELLRDTTVNTFLPWFPVQSRAETLRHLKERYLCHYAKARSYHYAVCLKTDPAPAGYVNISDDGSYDLGYGFQKECWGRGIATEACRAVINEVKSSGIPFLTATHDRNNPKSGAVMKRLGMLYRYSYEERVQPKDMLVTFRMYQLNFTMPDEWIYEKYRNRSAVHFIEETE